MLLEHLCYSGKSSVTVRSVAYTKIKKVQMTLGPGNKIDGNYDVAILVWDCRIT